MLRETTIQNGRIAGIPAADPRITVYKGIPFAAPPVGDLRWRPPQPVANWQGTYQADRFGPISMQTVPGIGGMGDLYNKEWHVDPDIAMSEDCLYLNVWTPAKTADEKLPVMFWIFGGGHQVGYPVEMEFDGERIARRGVVLVTVNYRLNVFGFMAHPEITAENPDFPANFGLLDQRAGLVWVQNNIAAFGGDPNNVTMFGQSAGGRSTMAQLTSPLNEGLFHKAIPQSGGGIAVEWNQNYPSLAEAEEIGKEFFDFIGVKTLAQAREIDARTLWELQAKFPLREDRYYHNWGVVIDGRFLKEHPTDVILRNGRHKVPVMTGCTGNEFIITPPADSAESFKEYAETRFGDDAPAFLALCGFGKDSLEACAQKGTYNFLELRTWLWAKRNTALQTSPMYVYYFNPPMPGDDAGAFHSSELWFTFETLAKCWRPFHGMHYDLARKMCNYWTNFAKTGDPNGNDADGTPMPQWLPYDENNNKAMFFGQDIGMTDCVPNPTMQFIVAYDDRELTAHAKTL